MESDCLQKPVRVLRKGLKTLDGDLAAEQVHKLRTRAREIETVALALKGADKKARRLLKAIKPVRKAAGDVRDLDVLTAGAMSIAGKTGARETEQESMRRLVDSLNATRKKNAAELLKVVDERRKRARQRLKRFARQLKEAFAEGESGAARLEDSVWAAIEELTAGLRRWPALNARNIHGFRLKLKELLALLQLEPGSDAGFVRALNHAKKQIGEWHDWQTLREMAREILDAREDGILLAQINKVVERKLAKALGASNTLRKRYLRPGFEPG